MLARDQLAPLGAETQVAAAEGNDPRLGRRTRRDREPVRPGAGAAHDVAGLGDATLVLDRDALAPRPQRAHPGARGDHPSRRLDVLRVRGRDPGEVDHARSRRMQRGDPAGVRLDLGDLVRVDPPQAGNPVGLAAPLELVEAGELTLVGGDDQLAVLARLDPALVAIGVEQAGPLDAEPRLQRARRVVDARRGSRRWSARSDGPPAGSRARARRGWSRGGGRAARAPPRARGCRRR